MNCESLRSRLEQRLTSALHAAEQIKAAIALIDEEVSAGVVNQAKLGSGSRDSENASVGGKTKRYRPGTPRPVGAPSNDVMFAKVLTNAHRSGTDSLSGGDVVRAIEETYWPGVTSYQLLPALYAAVRRGKLARTADGKFKAEHPGRRIKEAVGHTRRMSNGLM